MQTRCDNCQGFLGTDPVPVDGKGLCKYCARKAYEKVVERTASSWNKQQAIEWAEAEGRRYLMVESTHGGMFIQPGGLDGLNDSDVVFGCKGDNVVGWLEVGEVRRDCRITVP